MYFIPQLSWTSLLARIPQLVVARVVHHSVVATKLQCWSVELDLRASFAAYHWDNVPHNDTTLVPCYEMRLSVAIGIDIYDGRLGYQRTSPARIGAVHGFRCWVRALLDRIQYNLWAHTQVSGQTTGDVHVKRQAVEFCQ